MVSKYLKRGGGWGHPLGDWDGEKEIRDVEQSENGLGGG